MLIKAVNNINQIRPRFGNSQIHRFLKKHFVTDVHQLEQVMAELPDSKRIIGSLPYDWISDCEKSKLSEITHFVGLEFKNFADSVAKLEMEYIKKLYEKEYEGLVPPKTVTVKIADKLKSMLNMFLTKKPEKSEIYFEQEQKDVLSYAQSMKNLQKILSELLNKKVKIEQLSRGGFGTTFTIEVNGKKAVLKTFFRDKPQDNDFPHGKTAELVRGIFTQRHSTKNKFAKLYMGKVAGLDWNDNGFMLTKYIDKTNSKKYNEHKIHESIFDHIWSHDAYSEGNMIGGTVVDYGGLKINPALFSRQKIKVSRLFQKAIATNNKKLFDETFSGHSDSKEFKELLNYLKEQLNTKIIACCCLNENENALYMYKRLGLRFNPGDRDIFRSELASKFDNVGLFDESQHLRIGRDFNSRLKAILGADLS